MPVWKAPKPSFFVSVPMRQAKTRALVPLLVPSLFPTLLPTLFLVIVSAIMLMPVACSTRQAPPPVTVLQTPADPDSTPSSPAARAPESPNPIQNLHQLTSTLYSGSEPAGAPHYQQLASLGIQTVISVDAIPPNPSLAAQHNIRIIHLPIGYDGINQERAAQLTSALTQSDQPIYLHCHHGKHRGPAALTVGAIGAGLITTQQATDFLNTAGTSPQYPGLWDAVKNAAPIDPARIPQSADLPSSAPVSDFTSAMGEVDRLHERLWDIAMNNWETPNDHPDLTPIAVSAQIHNLLRSMLGSKIVEQEGSLIRAMMIESIEAADRVETSLRNADTQLALTSMGSLNNSCVQCHEKFRD
ncbi:MAG: hypothetical protein AB8C13_08935 [Phycisphaerales bacterium]